MWEMQPVKQLEEQNHTYVCSSACCFGGDREKWIGLLVNCQAVALALHQSACEGHDKLKSLKTYEAEERPDGALNYPTEEEAAYPHRWCAAHAEGRSLTAELQRRACVTLFELEEEMKQGYEMDHLAAMARKASIRRSDLYPAYRWFWEEKLSHSWHTSEHINYLEIRAFIAMLKRRIRQVHVHATRYLHIVDSSVTREAVAKGRSSSPQVNKLLRKICALCLVSDTYPLVAWTVSRWNFADLASRGKPPKHDGKSSASEVCGAASSDTGRLWQSASTLFGLCTQRKGHGWDLLEALAALSLSIDEPHWR
eukprot:s993_g16.t1